MTGADRNIRIGTPEEFERFYMGRVKPAGWTGYVREIEGVIVAVAGIYWDWDGKAWGFIDCRRKYLPDTKTVVRLTKLIMKSIADAGETVVYAKPDMRIKEAAYFLQWVGFRPSDDSGVWTWQAR
jgi:hypothetical protein